MSAWSDVLLAALARATVQGTIVLAAVWLLLRIAPAVPARLRCALWWMALLKLLVAFAAVEPLAVPILPSLSTSGPGMSRAHALALPSAAPLARPPGLVESQTARGSVAAAPTRWSALVETARVQWRTLLVIAWLLGVAIQLTLSAPGVLALCRIRRSSRPAPPALLAEADRLAVCIGLRATPSVRLSDAIVTPQVAGVRQPVVLLPHPGFAALAANDQAMALCHELVHVRRRDLWVAWLPALTERLFFFNPLVRLAAREYVLAREAACDADVLRLLDAEPHAYGRLLLVLGVSRASGLAAAGAPRSFTMLKRRLTMLSRVSPDRSPARRLAWMAIGLGVLALLPVRLGARDARQVADAGTARPTPVVATVMAGVPAPLAVARDDGPIVAVPRLAQEGESAAPAVAAEGGRRGEPRDENHKGGWVLLTDDDHTTMSGWGGDADRAQRYRHGREPLIWMRQGGHEYVIRDQSTIAKAQAIFAPMAELGERMGKLGAEQGELGHKQGEIGAKQGALGARQGELGAKQGALGVRQAELGLRQSRAQHDAKIQAELEQQAKDLDQQMAHFDREMKELSEQMEALNKPMADLAKQMEPLAKQQEELGRQMEELSKKAEAEMKRLLEGARSSGKAEQVH